SHHVERFFREARAAARLDDPGIVRVLDIGRTPEGAVWFAMEMVEGTSLSAWIKENGAMPATRAVTMVRDLARTLQRLHEVGIVHRDLKPSNVLLGPDGVVKLADFGIAGDMRDSEDRLTRTGQLLGTPAYMAPEVHMGVRPDVSWPLVDVYGLGMILLESLTGAAVVPEGEVYVRLEAAGEMVPMPRPLRLICEKATRERPEGRYATAGELRADLQRYLSAEAVLASPLSLRERSQLFWRRHRALFRTVGMTLGVLWVCIGLGYSLTARWEAKQQQLREQGMEGRLNATRSRIDQLRAEGRVAEAEELMDHFLQAPEHANHRAVTRAWLERAQAADADGREAEALAAYGRAWSGVDPAIARKAFRGIVGSLRRAGRWRPLSAALEMIRQGEGGFSAPERREVEVEL
ncbi:MAG TPA: serine/threonine-protein kinase, partial [Myxococcota bacterium]|nr:serine/threonine-protein kinase [Myxococcota bacterium]